MIPLLALVPFFSWLCNWGKSSNLRASSCVTSHRQLFIMFSSFTKSSAMQGYHTQVDNVRIAHLRLYSKRTRISTNTRTIFTYCILKLQTSESIYIIKHENENLKLIMYIVAKCAQLRRWGEISLQSLGSKRPLMLHGFVVVHEGGDERLEISTDKYFRATRSRTTREKADGLLR